MNDDDQKHKDAQDSGEIGDTDQTGENPDLESDDDVGEAAHKVGMYPDETEEVDIAGQIRKAEINHLKDD